MRRILRIKSIERYTFDTKKYKNAPFHYDGDYEYYSVSCILEALVKNYGNLENTKLYFLNAANRNAKIKIVGERDTILNIINALMSQDFVIKNYSIKVSWL